MGLLPKFIDDAAGPPAQAVGNTLSNLWELGIGSHVALWVKKQEVRQQSNLQDYIKKIEEKTQIIPEESIIEPPLHIVGPAIEASKFYIESETLREMFANLIASSIDGRVINQTHPSFVEIIKQLSPYDATVIKSFADITQAPIIRLLAIDDAQNYIVIQEHIMNFTDPHNYKMQATSLTNLQRLGLLEIDYSRNVVGQDKYEYIKNHPAYSEDNDKFIDIKRNNPSFTKIDLELGLCKITPLCVDFVKVCF